MFRRTVSRAATVTALAAATCIAGAGISSAATAGAPAVNGNTVSVEFALDQGQLADACAAVLSPTATAPQLAARFESGTVEDIINTVNDPNLKVLKDSFTNQPVTFPSLAARTTTVRATDVPSNVYSLVTACANGGKAKVDVTPAIMVGNPIEGAIGSIQSGSSQDNLGAMSSIITGTLTGN